jgi:hypothetical protein
MVKRSEIKILRCVKHHKSRSCDLYIVNIHYDGKHYSNTITNYGGRPTRKTIIDQFIEEHKLK